MTVVMLNNFRAVQYWSLGSHVFVVAYLRFFWTKFFRVRATPFNTFSFAGMQSVNDYVLTGLGHSVRWEDDE